MSTFTNSSNYYRQVIGFEYFLLKYDILISKRNRKIETRVVNRTIHNYSLFCSVHLLNPCHYSIFSFFLHSCMSQALILITVTGIWSYLGPMSDGSMHSCCSCPFSNRPLFTGSRKALFTSTK